MAWSNDDEARVSNERELTEEPKRNFQFLHFFVICNFYFLLGPLRITVFIVKLTE